MICGAVLQVWLGSPQMQALRVLNQLSSSIGARSLGTLLSLSLSLMGSCLRQPLWPQILPSSALYCLLLSLLVPPQGRGSSLPACWRDLVNLPRGYMTPPPGSLIEHASQKGMCCPSNVHPTHCGPQHLRPGAAGTLLLSRLVSTRPSRHRPGEMVQCLRTVVLTETQVHFFTPT